MRCSELRAAACLLGLGVFLVGCDRSASSVTTDMHADFGHDHRHQHGPGHDHEHDHKEGFQGGHEHPHAHGHRHGEPLHGGRIVSIGHSHHASGETHYHAEVMPVVDGRLTFHVLTEDAEGSSEDFRVETAEIVAYVDRLDEEAARPHEVVFKAEGEEAGSTFSAAVPEPFLESKELSVVVPKIKLGGERLNFSFSARAEGSPSDPQPSDEAAEQPAT